MRKIKMILAAATLLLLVGSAMAFRSAKVKSFYLYKLDTNGNCSQQFVGTPNNTAPFMAYNTQPILGACPISGRVKTPE